jgi:hypothetical protein
MPLLPPKRNAAGFFVALQSPEEAPRLAWTATGTWTLTEEWSTWASQKRQELLGELVSHGSWFSKPPRHDLLESLFGLWDAKNLQGVRNFFCKVPEVPGASGSTGSCLWLLQGLLMTSSSITPVWAVTDVKEDETQDTISLFGDGETVDGSSDAEEEKETREIRFDEIEDAPAAAAPTRLRNREWEAQKFMAKERVRELRLKAQIADRMAAREEARFYEKFGDLDDSESHFSEYDLTDEEESDAGSKESS